jgi:hypothetical protein
MKTSDILLQLDRTLTIIEMVLLFWFNNYWLVQDYIGIWNNKQELVDI